MQEVIGTRDQWHFGQGSGWRGREWHLPELSCAGRLRRHRGRASPSHLAGFARIHVTEGSVSFPVNGPIPRVMLAAAKDKQGRFAVDALATDGGGIPRNDMISSGLRLVDLEVFSLADFVHKACWAPAQILGLPHKGHLAEGADADITIIDQTAAKAETTISAGQVVMHHGVEMGRGTRFLTTSRGAAAVAAAGLEPLVVDLAASAFYQAKEAIRWKR